MATRDNSIKVKPLSTHERLLKLKSLLSTIRMASLYQMDEHPELFDISEVVEMVETEIGNIAETLEK
jgi:hypothetical protein